MTIHFTRHQIEEIKRFSILVVRTSTSLSESSVLDIETLASLISSPHPYSGSAVSVSGFRDISSGNYTIQLDDETFTFDGESSWKEATQLFFQTGLDPTTSHQLTITNVDNRLLAVGSINVTSVSGASA